MLAALPQRGLLAICLDPREERVFRRNSFVGSARQTERNHLHIARLRVRNPKPRQLPTRPADRKDAKPTTDLELSLLNGLLFESHETHFVQAD